MEVRPATGAGNSAGDQLSVDAAMQVASWTWFGLLTLPFVLFILVVWHQMSLEGTAGDAETSTRWFIISMAYMAIGVPTAFFLRSKLFRGYWSGQLVSPKNYLAGMILIWSALEFGGLLSLVGCLVSGKLLPNLVPALLAFMLFTPLWPNGHAMTRRLQNEHDPADYEEPR
jgi:hypothetical protein